MKKIVLSVLCSVLFCAGCGHSSVSEADSDDQTAPVSGNDASLFSGYERSVDRADAVEGQLMERADRHKKQLEDESGG